MDVWETLVPILMEESHESNLLLMIKDTLVNMNDGVLAKVDGGVEQLAGLNSWLMFITVKSVNNFPDNLGLLDAAVQLQSEILTACFHKDLQLLRHIYKNLVNFVQDLLSKASKEQFPLKISFMTDANRKPISISGINLNDTSLVIKDSKSLYAILLIELQVFTEMNGLIVHTHHDFNVQITDMCMSIFKNGPMQLKLEVLNYFTEGLKINMRVEETHMGYFISIINYFGRLLRYNDIWVKTCQDKFISDAIQSSLKGFLKEIARIDMTDKQNFLKMLIEGMNLWIVNVGECLLESKPNSWEVRQLGCLAKRTLKKLNDDSNQSIVDKKLLIQYINFLEIFPELCSLFVGTVTKELENNSEKELFSVLTQNIIEFSKKTISIHSIDEYEEMENILRYWKEIFCLFGNINECFTHHAQLEYMDMHDKFPFYLGIRCCDQIKQFKAIFNEVIASILNKISTTKLNLSTQFMAVVLMDFLYAALRNLSETSLISDEIQVNLMYFFLSSFCKTGKILSDKLPKNIINFYETRKSDIQRYVLIMNKCLNLLFNINIKSLQNQDIDQLVKSLLEYVTSSATCASLLDEIVKLVPKMIINSNVEVSWILKNILTSAFNQNNNQQLIGILLDIVNLSKQNSVVIYSKNSTEVVEYLIMNPSNVVKETKCTCDLSSIKNENVTVVLQKLKKNNGILIDPRLNGENRQQLNEIISKYKNIITSTDTEVRKTIIPMLPQLINNVDFMLEESIFKSWFGSLSSKEIEINSIIPLYIKSIINQVTSKFECNPNSFITSEKLSQLFREELLKAVEHALTSKDEEIQSNCLKLMQNYAASENITESDILFCFRFALRFLMKVTSKVKYQAYGTVEKICKNYNVRPFQMLNWYRMNNMKFLMEIVAANYLDANVKMMETVQELPKLFGFMSLAHFIIRYHKSMTAVLLPIILKVKKCSGILIEIASICNKDPDQILQASFSQAYPYAYLRHSPETAKQCIDYMKKSFGHDIISEVIFKSERAVSEVLVYYHKNSECVLEIFKYLQINDKKSQPMDPVFKLSDYLGKNTLGVLKHFELNINVTGGEKGVQTETLLSLGQIIRLIGTERITPFRYKIMTILNTALNSNDKKIIEISIKVWHIFVHTVDMIELGPLLSSIIVSLKSFIEDYPEEIDDIFTYLIVENSNLMCKHFSDVFFLDELPIREDLKAEIGMKQRNINRKPFLEQLDEYLQHISHKNIIVRGYGLKYLAKILRKNRTELNNLIINDGKIHPILGGLLRNLMICCKENDANIQKHAAECLGELGALEPSHLPPDYQPHSGFAFSIHTQEFAILALEKLCHAYQVQSDVRNVDCFALAIQEVLISNNVDPILKQNIEIWNAMPVKMRPLIEPLLKSQYSTAARRRIPLELHPVYGSIEAKSFEEWAYIWATKLIEQIPTEVTKNLLDAFIPSLKSDMQILALVFPYIILHSILTGSTRVQNEIFGEITTVLEDTMNQKNGNESMDTPEENCRSDRSLVTIQFFNSQNISQKSQKTENMQLKCAKIVFGLLDFLERYLNELTIKYAKAHEKDDYRMVKKFIEMFDYKMLARANYECEEYARALWYIEQYINYDSGSRLQGELGFLAKIHAELLDPDSVEGAMAVKEDEPSIEEQILTYNVTGRLHESAVCFERLMQLGNPTPAIMKEMVECYLGLDQPETALLVSESFYAKFAKDNQELELRANCAEPLWRLSRWDDLNELIQDPSVKDSDIWGINCGRLLIDFRANNHEHFNEEIDSIRLSLLRVLKTHESEQSIYQKCYSQILKLHMLTEIQKTEEIMNEIGPEVTNTRITKILNNILTDWASRNELLQPTSNIMEPLLCLRRILLSEMQQLLNNRLKEKPRVLQTVNETINQSIGKLWVESTRLASKAKMFQQASLYIFNAEKYKPPELYIEKAKLFWEKGDQSNAFKVLDKGINDTMQAIGGEIRVLSPSDIKLFAEARLLVAVYNSESAKFSPEFNLKCYKEAIETYNQLERAHFLYAQYFERLYDSLSETQQQQTRMVHDYLVYSMINYGKSLMFGCHYIYQSMPRLLTIWLDYTARKDEKASKYHMQQLNQYMQRYIDTLPKFMFFTAFSQLVSRICHPNPEVYTILKSILVYLILAYPQQSLWMFLGIFKSTYENRMKRCKEILHDKRLASIDKFIWNFNSLTEIMINVTNSELSSEEERSSRLPNSTIKTTISRLHPAFHKFFQSHKDLQILMPIQAQNSLIMPPSRDRDKPADHHNPFPNEPIYIKSVLDPVLILSSLQKPKKITLVGSDGREYDFLMKPKDDLRKDFRLMEFNNVINQLLYEDTDARQRRLYIRTYGVFPLNDECGLIEWVQNVTPYRNIVMRYYKQLGKGMSLRDLKTKYPKKTDSTEKKKQIFEQILLPNYPHVFGDWFRERFPNPHNWYQARSCYVKTLAVMSMVGYILGLGDRHGENILMDAASGDLVHVDFNCLFNRGEQFEWPELVPFRLTHNMVKAMGPLGVDGLYRKCCEITMRVMQTQQNTLKSVLKPFVYDPLVSWTKTTSKAQMLNQERTDPQALENLRQIENRLKGFVKIDGKRSAAPLSVIGQVNHCITESTSVSNLSSMYLGWGSFY
uniref:Serine/threonine-protein kinase ATR n=1 Tax=Culicoides sonorensis TaxID=179676 RepID=A0A336KU49_CULSO